jgi:hypothetical protein
MTSGEGNAWLAVLGHSDHHFGRFYHAVRCFRFGQGCLRPNQHLGKLSLRFAGWSVNGCHPWHVFSRMNRPAQYMGKNRTWSCLCLRPSSFAKLLPIHRDAFCTLGLHKETHTHTYTRGAGIQEKENQARRDSPTSHSLKMAIVCKIAKFPELEGSLNVLIKLFTYHFWNLLH